MSTRAALHPRTHPRRIATAALVGAAALGVAATHVIAATPAGAQLVFATRGDDVSGRLEIATVRADGTGFRKLTRHHPVAATARWTTRGGLVLTAGDEGDEESNWAMRSDGSRLRRLPGGFWDIVSPSGRFVAVLDGKGIRFLDAAGRTVGFAAPGLRDADIYAGPPLWSPNERYVAVELYTETDCCEYSRTLVVRREGGKGAVRALTPPKNGAYEAPVDWYGRDTLVVHAGDGLLTVRPDGSGRRSLRKAPSDWAFDVSPDGAAIAWVAKAGGLWVAPLRSGRAQRLAPTKRTRAPFLPAWSADGRQVAFLDGGVWIVDTGTGKRRRVWARNAYAAWSPDGARLSVVDRDGVFVVRARDGRTTRLTRHLHDDNPVVSPDWSHIAFLRGSVGLSDYERIGTYVMRADGTGVRLLGRGYGARWSHDSRWVAWVEPLADGARNGRVWLSQRDGSGKRSLGIGSGPKWAPDGSRVAFAETVRRGERAGIRIAARDGAATQRIDDALHFAWSPDGSTLAYMRYDGELADDGEDHVTEARLVLDTLGSGEPRELAHWRLGERGSVAFGDPSWSPDGRVIAVRTAQAIAFVDTGSDGVREVAIDVSGYSWAPDGEVLLYRGDNHLGLVRPDATGHMILTRRKSSEYTWPSWSPDGRRVGFVRCDNGRDGPEGCDVFVIGRDGRGLRRVTRTPGVEGVLNWSPRLP